VSHDEFSGKGATLDLDGEPWTFVVSVDCKSCRKKIELLRPSFRIFDTDLYCQRCSFDFVLEGKPVKKETHTHFTLKTKARLLDLTLCDIGVPWLHAVPVRSTSGDYLYYELTNDESILFPNVARQNGQSVASNSHRP
jgi:hypothetical protein